MLRANGDPVRHGTAQEIGHGIGVFGRKGLGVIASIAVSAETGQVNTDLMEAGQIYTDLVTSGYSRKLETAADKQGLDLMIAAGYPPDHALPAFETMRIADDDTVSLDKMWSSHPDIDSRKKNLAKHIKKSEVEHGTRGLDEEAYLRGVRLAALTDSQLQIARGNIDLAIARLERFTELVDDDAMGFYLLAEAYRRKDMDGMFAQRTAAYQRTVDLDPNIPQAHRELGLALRQQKQFAEAEAALRQYLIVAPDAADGPIVEWYLDNLTAAAGDSQ